MIDELIYAVEKLQKAKAKYEIASKDCHHDKGYFLCEEQKAIDEAKEELTTIFRNAVASVVVEVINNRSYLPK